MNNVEDTDVIAPNSSLEGEIEGAASEIMPADMHLNILTRFWWIYRWTALQKEMQVDMQRIWKRNLGRDDRCIGDHGVEVFIVRSLCSMQLN